MPYNRNYKNNGGRRRYYNRGMRYKYNQKPNRKVRIGPQTRWQSYGNAFRQLASDVQQIKGLVNTEFKWVDTSTAIVPSTTPTIQLLNGLAKGDAVNTREGRSVRLKSWEMNYFIQIHASATPTIVRMTLVMDTQHNGGVNPGYGDIFQGTGISAVRNLNNRIRFVILKDWYHTMANGTNEIEEEHHYLKIDYHTIYDSGNTGNETDISDNALYLVCAANQATNTPSLNYVCRVRFLDN